MSGIGAAFRGRRLDTEASPLSLKFLHGRGNAFQITAKTLLEQKKIGTVTDQDVGLGAVHVTSTALVPVRIRTRPTRAGLVNWRTGPRVQRIGMDPAVQIGRSTGSEIDQRAFRFPCHILLDHHAAMDRPGRFDLPKGTNPPFPRCGQESPDLCALGNTKAIDPSIRRSKQGKRTVDGRRRVDPGTGRITPEFLAGLCIQSMNGVRDGAVFPGRCEAVLLASAFQ